LLAADAVSNSDTVTGTAAHTATDSFSGTGGQSWALHQQGSFSNFSTSYSSVVYQSLESVNVSVTATSADSFSGSRIPTRNETVPIGGTQSDGPHSNPGQATVSRGDSQSMTVASQAALSETHTSSDSVTMYQAGSYAGGSFSLTSVSYGESYSDSFAMTATDSSTEVGQQTHTATGTLVDLNNLHGTTDSQARNSTNTITSTQ